MMEKERGICLWVVSDDEELLGEVREALVDHACCTRLIPTEQASTSSLWRTTKPLPGAMLLDVGENMDKAVQILHHIKRAHIRSPIIVLSRDPSKEFGMKIVSAGINYFLPRDFDARELREVVSGLIKT